MKNKLFSDGLPKNTFLESIKTEPFLAYEYPVQPPVQSPPDTSTPEIPEFIRDQHVHVAGQTGYGKSTLLQWQIYKDIKAGKGVCVIDPKGDLVEKLLYFIPDSRVQDCIFLDMDAPIPLDFMSCPPGQEERVVDDLKYILTRGVSIENAHTVEANAERLIYTLLDANQHIPEEEKEKRATFLDINDFLEDPERQAYLLKYVSNKKLYSKWKNEPLNPTDRSRITNRMNKFVLSKTLSTIFGHPNPNLKLPEVIKDKKILLVKVPAESPAALLYGALLFAKIQHFAFSIHNEEDRVPFYVYIDEFQNFRASETFDKTLKMARGYKLCMTIANLTVDELDPKLQSALGIISTYIALQINPKDKAFYASILGDKNPHEELERRVDRLGMDLQTKPHDFGKMSAVSNELSAARRLLEERRALYNPPTVQDALSLPKYKAIFKIGDSPAMVRDTPARSPAPTPERKGKAQFIKSETIRIYGMKAASPRIGQIRTGDKPAGNNTKSVLELKHDAPRRTNDDGNASTPSTLLSNPAKKAGPRKPR